MWPYSYVEGPVLRQLSWRSWAAGLVYKKKSEVMRQNATSGASSTKSMALITVEVVSLLSISAFALIGNLLVITVIYKSRRVQWLTNLFVAHLAGANLLVPLLCGPIYVEWSIKGSWSLGKTMCKLVHFAHFVNNGISICMLACMALDRYYVIVHPLSLHMGRSQTFQLITFVWTYAIFTSTPTLYFYDTFTSNETVFCDAAFDVTAWKGYIVAFTVLSFALPLAFTGVLYGIVLRTIVKRNSFDHYQLTVISPSSCNQKVLGKVPKTKQRVVRMLLIQTILFVCCWLPFLARQFIETWTGLQSHGLFVIAFWLACFNSSCSPILYSVMNSNFRKGCKHLCSVHVSKPYALTHVMNRKNQVDVIGMEHSRHDSYGKAPDTDTFVLGKRSEENYPSENIVKLFEVSSREQKEAWSSETNGSIYKTR